MEAVAAVGVAAAAVQFLDFSTKTLALCKQIRDSSTGSTEDNAELTKSTNKLTEMQKGLRAAGNTSSSIYRKLLQVVKDCSAVASDLLQLLEDFKQLARKRLGAMRSAFKIIKDGRKVERLEKRLADCQAKFTLALTMDMREGVLDLLEKQGVLSDELRNTMMPKLEQMNVQSTALHSATRSQIRSLQQGLKSSTTAIHKQAAANHTEQLASIEGISRGQNRLGKSIDKGFNDVSDSSSHQSFLQSLYFNDMFARQQSITPQSHGTYDWILSGDSPYKGRSDEKWVLQDAELRGRLLRWLQSDQPLFWINGKAGSGKSSLMSFIESDKRTKAALETWARTRKLYTFSFFFWRPGLSLQKSIAGLLRSILHQVASAIPAVVPRVLSNRQSLTYTDWTQAKLLDALKTAFSVCQNDANGAVFLMIDGLDEFEGSYRHLLDAVMSFQSGSNIKLCVSSRPEATIMNKLERFPSISLQDLNYHDIQRYVAKQLESPGNTQVDLIWDVTRRAEGVFLWAVLVCQSLVVGLDAGDDKETMKQRLSILPSGLMDLFNSMFSKIDGLHRKDLALYFALLKWERSPHPEVFKVSIALVTTMLCKPPYESFQQFIDTCKTTHRRISAQSKGLIQILRPNPMDNSLRVWTFKDIATGGARHQYLDQKESASMREWEVSTLEWCHRSAYDCFLGDASGCLKPEMIQMNEPDFERQALRAFTWLGQHTSVYEYNATIPSRGTRGTPMYISSLIESAAPDIEDEGFQALDTIHDALQSSIFDAGEPVSCLFTPEGLKPHVYILLHFWQPLTRLDKYWTVRFEQIKQSKFATSICCGLLGNLHGYELRFADQRRPELWLLLTKCLLEKYSFESQGAHETCSSLTGFPFTWASSGRYLEQRDMLPFIEACAGLTSPSDYHMRTESSEDYRDTMLATADAKQLFVGGQASSGERGAQPLQIALPLQHVICGHKTVFSSSFKRMRANLRLICFKSSPTRGKYTGDACFDLSVRLTGYMLEFCTVIPQASTRLWSTNVTTIAFAGTPCQRERCLQLVIQEIWQDTESELDAWSQLYILACVKKSFRAYWRIAVSDDGSEAGKITNDADLISESISSESPPQPTHPSAPYSASPSTHPSAKAQPHQQPDP
jgi:hypothetical protein